jgi:hypothetical protein
MFLPKPLGVDYVIIYLSGKQRINQLQNRELKLCSWIFPFISINKNNVIIIMMY